MKDLQSLRLLKKMAEFGTDAEKERLLTHADFRVRAKVAKYGTDAQKQRLLEDKNWRVRLRVAWYGTDEQAEILKNDAHKHVRTAASSRNDLKKIEGEKLKFGEDSWNHCEAQALYGTDADRERLLDHPNWRVRQAIAKCGNDAHRRVMMSDPHPFVREAANAPKKHVVKKHLAEMWWPSETMP